MNTGSALARFTITLSTAVTEPVQVEWHTSDGTAKASVDYAANKGIVIFAPGETAKTVDILVYGRAVGSEDRSFFVEMLPPTNAILGQLIGECIITVDTSGSTPVTKIIVPTGPVGPQGKSAYQSYLDTTTDNPPKTEAEWVESLKGDPAEIALEVAPLIDVGATVLTAEGTETLGKPDKATVKAVARRVAYAAPAKIATVVLADGDNSVVQSDMTGDTLDMSSEGLYPRIMRGSTVLTPHWSIQPDGKMLIKGAVAGDVLYVCQYDFISAKKSNTNTRELWRRSLAEAGLTLVDGSFEEGATVSNKTDVVWYIAGGQCYFWDGAFPKVVPVGSTPASTGGIVTGAWQLEASATLRNQLADAALVERNGFLSTQDHISIRPYILTTANHTDALQAAINAVIGEVAVIDLGMTELEISTVNVTAAGKSITFRNGKITVVGVASKGFSRVKTDTGTLAKYDMSFDNVHFVKSDAGGSCIEIDIAWQDATGGVDINSNCSFNLTNGAIGIRLKKSFGNNIRGRYLMDSTSTAIICDASEPVAGDIHPQGPMETVVDDAMFSGGIGFDQLLNPSSSWNSFEGFSFGPGARFYASKFKAKKYNGLKFNGVHGVSWNAELDSGMNTSICGGYYDKQNSSDWIFKFLTTVRSSQGIVFSGGAVISAQGNAGNMVIFTDDNTAALAQITCVVLGDVYLISGDYSPSSLPVPSRGFWFDHALLSHVSVSSSLSFQAIFACLSFNKPINRSVINGFDAKETVWYAESVAIGYSGGFNRFDGVYREIEEIELMVPTYISNGVNEPVFVENIFFENMMRPPIATVSNIVSITGAGQFTITVPLTYRNGLRIYLVKNASAPGGTRGAATAKIVLDSSKYLVPL